ncbi:hypothetical protein fugu_007866 [Takifugu bimaculatus]|uniref:Chemokine interleukin-8-like domain-containing protein n=1 Tax=Takifugu bimaculatus TaxID=433685 RepID=A0A4Z2B0W5_9TELE|nr:hypothetical protein fugu_007866 [Takifugu bimaculatus]
MCSKVFLTSLVVLLAFLAISNGMSLRSLGVEQHCRCIQTESRPIGRHIGKVELIPPNSHCEETEIIATLKESGQEVCLDPKAPWVKKVINKIMSRLFERMPAKGRDCAPGGGVGAVVRRETHRHRAGRICRGTGMHTKCFAPEE